MFHLRGLDWWTKQDLSLQFISRFYMAAKSIYYMKLAPIMACWAHVHSSCILCCQRKQVPQESAIGLKKGASTNLESWCLHNKEYLTIQAIIHTYVAQKPADSSMKRSTLLCSYQWIQNQPRYAASNPWIQWLKAILFNLIPSIWFKMQPNSVGRISQVVKCRNLFRITNLC